MKSKTKCIIGATVLTPIILCILLFIATLLSFGARWVCDNFPGWVPLSMGGIIFASVFGIPIWKLLYDNCVESKRPLEDD